MRGWIGCLMALPLLALSGCPDSGTVCGDVAVTAACSEELGSRLACTTQGGCWGTWGLAPGPSCNCPTDDAGEPCATGGDCQGHCLADSEDGVCPDEGECSDMERVYGCFCFLQEGSDEPEMCVD